MSRSNGNEDLKKKSLSLEGFPKGSLASWKDLVEAELKGVPFDKKLIKHTYEGISVEPLYTKENASIFEGSLVSVLKSSGNKRMEEAKWEICEELPMEQNGYVSLNLLSVREAGASCMQELGIGLAMAVEKLRELEGASSKGNQLSFYWISAASSDFFMEVAKFRAMRILWASIAERCGTQVVSERLLIASKTASLNKSRLDAHVNILRSTSEALSMAIGGCDLICVSPFDEPLNASSDLSRRIARNVQILLQEESHIDAVCDAAGGSYYVETLTHELCKKAWSFFQQIEEGGGLNKALSDRFIQEEISSVAAERKAAVSQRREVLVGTSMYVNADEEIQWDDTEADATKASTITGLRNYRVAADYERLRQASARYKKEKGKLPRIFLLNMGPLSQHKARADFCRSFLEPGGFDVISPDGFDELSEAVEAFVESGAGIGVLCSTDETYLEIVSKIAPLFKERTPGAALILAGYPEGQIEALKEAGIDDFIHLRANNVKLLQSFHKIMGVSA